MSYRPVQKKVKSTHGLSQNNRHGLSNLLWLGIGICLLLCAAGSTRAQAPTITNLQNKTSTTAVGWKDGTGPFLLQRKANLTDPTWFNLITTSNRNTVVPKDLQTAFYRLQDITTNLALPFTAVLAGTNEVPSVVSGGTGLGVFSLEGSNLTYYITFSGLSGNATGGHIHGNATPTNTAGVLIPFTVPSAPSGVVSGTATLSADNVAALVNGMLYVNFHTSANINGEIRGQIVPLRIGMNLNGANEVPPIVTSASANGYLTLIGNTVFYDINYFNLSGGGTAAHFHGPASTTNSTGVLVPINAPSGSNGNISGSVNLTPVQLYFLLSGQLYMNMHSGLVSSGEIRNQVFPMQLGAYLSGPTEVPTNTSPGIGTAFMTITNSVLTYNVTFSGLTTNATMAHIHGPADATHSTGVLIGFPTVPSATSGVITGTANLTTLQLFYLVTGQTYANIHSVNFSGGEIRGQLYPRN
jgi:hypothetical protein